MLLTDFTGSTMPATFSKYTSSVSSGSTELKISGINFSIASALLKSTEKALWIFSDSSTELLVMLIILLSLKVSAAAWPSPLLVPVKNTYLINISPLYLYLNDFIILFYLLLLNVLHIFLYLFSVL